MANSGRSPQSHAHSSGREVEYQMGFPEESLSIGELMQNSAAALENEILHLQKEIEMQSLRIKELKENCSFHSENISKQDLELEHLKVLTHTEVMKRESSLRNFSNLKEKFQKLENYFGHWYKGINIMSPSMEELLQFSNQKTANIEQQRAVLNQEEKLYNNALNDSKQFVQHLAALQGREENEFNEIIAHLKRQLSTQSQEEKELEKQLSDVKSDCREEMAVKNMISPQINSLNQTYEQLQQELTTSVKRTETITEQLQSTLQEEIKKRETVSANTEATEKMICEINNTLRDKETEINTLGTKQKELIVKEEDDIKKYDTEVENLNNLQSTSETIQEELNSLLAINEENSTLLGTCGNMEKISEDYTNTIVDINNVEVSFLGELETLNQSIGAMESEKSSNIYELSVIEDQIKELQKEMNNDATEHRQISIEIDNPYNALSQEQTFLKHSIDKLNEKLTELNKNKSGLENILADLKIELERTKAITQENDAQLFSHAEEFGMIINNLCEEDMAIDEMISKSLQQYIKAQSDMETSKEIKETIKQLETDLENQTVSLKQSVKQVQESHNKQIEVTSRLLADFKFQQERELRETQRNKRDALVELKENKALITDLEQQKKLCENEILRTENKLEKCNNLVRKLENKLKIVAQVASAQHSQSVADLFSQTKNVLLTSQATKATSNRCAYSPCSDSSGKTFNPDEIDLSKIKKTKTFSKRPNDLIRKPNILNKKSKTEASSAVKDLMDDWYA